MKTHFSFPFLASLCLLLCFPFFGNDSILDSIVETWDKDAPRRCITVSFLLPYGVGITERKDFP